MWLMGLVVPVVFVFLTYVLVWSLRKKVSYFDSNFEKTLLSFFLWLGVGVSGVVGPICLHADSLGTIAQGEQAVIVQQQRIEELQSTLNKVLPIGKQHNAILLNADSPIKALTESLSHAHKDLATARTKIANAKIDIAQRKRGLSMWVVWIMGER